MGCGVRVSSSSVENFLPHSAENFCMGTLQCFINFGYRKTLCLWGEYHDFLLKICCLTVPKNFVDEPFFVSQSFWYRKSLWIRGEGGVSRFFVRSFLSQSAEKFRRGTLQCVTNFGYRKILCFRELCHDFLLNFFLSHSAEKFRRGPVCVSENFGYRKTLCLWGEYHDFLWKICSLTVPKNFVDEPFFVSQSFWYRKSLWIRGEGGVSRFFVRSFLSQSAEKFRRGTLQCVTNFGYRKILCFRELCHDFLLNFFLSHSAEKFRRGPVCVSENFGYRKTLCLWGEYHDFLWKICSLTVPKNFVGEPFFVSQSFWCRKSLWIRGEGGVSRFFVRSFLSQSAEKFRRGTLLICVSENVR